MKQNHELTHHQEAVRRGSDASNARVAIAAKAMIAHIRANPGCTRQDIFAALGDAYVSGGFDMLKRHKLAFHIGQKPARWFANKNTP